MTTEIEADLKAEVSRTQKAAADAREALEAGHQERKHRPDENPVCSGSPALRWPFRAAARFPAGRDDAGRDPFTATGYRG